MFSLRRKHCSTHSLNFKICSHTELLSGCAWWWPVEREERHFLQRFLYHGCCSKSWSRLCTQTWCASGFPSFLWPQSLLNLHFHPQGQTLLNPSCMWHFILHWARLLFDPLAYSTFAAQISCTDFSGAYYCS